MKFLKNNVYKPCAFFDRDGVFNEDSGYVHTAKKTKWKKNIFTTIKLLNDNSYRVIIITNQAGIAKGLYNEDDLKRLHLYIKNFLYNKDIYFDDVQYCPYHPKGIVKKYKKKRCNKNYCFRFFSNNHS